MSWPTRRFWLAQSAGWAFYGVLVLVPHLYALPYGTGYDWAVMKGVRAVYGLVFSTLLYLLFEAWRRRGMAPRRAVLLALPSIVGAAIVWFVSYRYAITPFMAPGTVPVEWSFFPRAVLELTLVLLTWSGVYVGWLAWRAAAERERAAEYAWQSTQAARMEALAHQVSPHFLFNALNVLRALIEEDPARAQRMAAALARYLRSTLEQREPMRPLGEELGALASYLHVEQVRFESGLRHAVHVEPDVADVLVPAFLLHPLVENAVKHGARRPDAPLEVDVHAARVGDRVRIDVRNTGRLTGAVRPAGAGDCSGIGLRNVRERLAHVYPGSHRFRLVEEDARVIATVELPHGGRHA